jgi:hypothetical protein
MIRKCTKGGFEESGLLFGVGVGLGLAHLGHLPVCIVVGLELSECEMCMCI